MTSGELTNVASNATAEQSALDSFSTEARRYTWLMVGYSFFLNLLVLTVPLYMLQVFDRVLTSRNTDTLLSLTLVALVALLAFAFLDAARAQVLARLGYQFDQRLAPVALDDSLSASLGSGGAPSAQGLRDIGTVRMFLNSSAATSLLDLPWLPVFLIVIFLLHPLMALMATLGALLLLGLAALGEIGNRASVEANNTRRMQQLQDAESGIRNARAFQAMGISGRWITRWTGQNNALLADTAGSEDRNSALLSLSRFFRMGLQLGVLGLGAYLTLRGELTPGGMIAASILVSRALTPVEQSIGSFKSLLSARQAYREVCTRVEGQPRRKSVMSLPRPSGLLQVENVTYIHPGESEPCLYGIDFSLLPGESLGLIGPSGAGKSTLGDLLVGNLAPRLGHVRLDGMDLAQWPSVDRGQYLGYLPQSVDLMSGTVLDNISRMNTPDKEKIIAAAKLAGAHEMIMRLPRGYDTEVGEQGALLSAGQRQRIALARAVYGEVALVVLDEPNAHLDREGELALAEALRNLRSTGVTVVTIAHRPSVLESADKLLVLRDGRTTAYGPREEIIRKVTAMQNSGQLQT